jgi:hypothetical protein
MRMVTPKLPIPSVAVASPASVALLQLAAMPFSVANTLLAACASRVPGAAAPWSLYGLKIAGTQSALKPIVLFRGCLMIFARLAP